MKKTIIINSSKSKKMRIVLIGIIFYSLLFSNCFPQSGWVKQTIGYSYDYIPVIKFFNQNKGIAFSEWNGMPSYYGRIFKTTNAGVNWTSTLSPYPDSYYDFYSFNDSNYVLSGQRGNGFGLIALYSNNVRNDVLISPLIGESVFLFCTSWLNSNTGIVAGNDFGPGGAIRRLLKTTNHGVNWTDISIPYSVVVSAVYDCKYIDSNIVYAIGDMNFIRSTNGGANWAVLSSLQSGNTNFLVASKDTFYIYGGQGQFKISIDSGNTWQQRQIGYNFRVLGASFLNSKTGWICGDTGYIFKTTNAGLNWVKQTSGTKASLAGISILDVNNLWIGGDSGIVLKTTTGGETFIRYEGNTIVNNYKLEQNYPNPFNPVTKIKYQISSLVNVKIIVYDLLGREVKTLVNEKQLAGEYEASFDGNNLNSGIYFYRIQAGNYTQVKRMVLIK